MRRLLFAASLCVATVLPAQSRDHNVRILWVSDSVMAQLQDAANDSLESLWQVVSVKMGKVATSANDSGFIITGIIPCPGLHRYQTTTGDSRCPNAYAPTIHVHPVVGSAIAAWGNNCSPSRQDYQYQLERRHQFDAIICGRQTRPTAFWFAQNPLLGTDAYPDTLTPIGPSRVSP